MSEKRFEFYSDEDLVGVLDIVTGRTFNSFEIVDVLNEQQATIEQQEQSITILTQEIADTQAILEMLSEKLKGWNNE